MYTDELFQRATLVGLVTLTYSVVIIGYAVGLL